MKIKLVGHKKFLQANQTKKKEYQKKKKTQKTQKTYKNINKKFLEENKNV
jgi:hypothetical protein